MHGFAAIAKSDIIVPVSLFTLRPTACRMVDQPAQDVLAQFSTFIERSGGRYEGEILSRHVTLTIPDDRRHFWSPWYNIDVESDESDASRSQVRLRFSPHPNIWTSVALTYLALFTAGTLAGLFGFSQMMADASPTAFFIVPVCIVIAAGVLIASHIGQSLAAEQMAELESAVNALLTGA